MAFTQSDLDAIELAQYQVFFDDLNLGYIVDGSLSVAVAGNYTNVETVNQFEGIVKQWNRANIPTIGFSVFANSVEYLRTKLMKNQVEAETFADGSSKIGLGVKTRSSTTYEGVLLLTPYPSVAGDYSKDIRIPKAVIQINFDNIIAGSKDSPAELAVSVNALPDTSQPTGYEYATLGNWSRSSDTPLGVSVSTYQYVLSDDARMSLGALTLRNDEKHRLECHIHYGSISTSVVTAINFGAGYSATDTSLVLDSVTGISSGDFVRITTSGPVQEYARVSNVDGGTNTITVERNALGSTAQAIADGDAVALVTSVSSEQGRDKATWASSDDSKVTVGNTFQGSGAANKGVVSHVASGSSNITATFNSVSSPSLAITAS